MSDTKWAHQVVFIYKCDKNKENGRKAPLCRSKSLVWNGKGRV